MSYSDQAKQDRRDGDLRRHREALEDQARRQTDLMREANELAGKRQSAAGSSGASTGSDNDTMGGIVVLLVLAVVVGVIAIVVTYWLDSYAFNRKQKYFNKPQVKQPQVVG
jgi:cytochrome c-type biogenesis protein CcmH/NrfG